MRLLINRDLRLALQDPAGDAVAYVMGGNPLQPQPLSSANIKSASLDLTIGSIFLPGSLPDDLGGCNKGRGEYNLNQGHTAVVRTREILRMGPERAAVAFPPSHVSLKGLLMTNPGHIDPGYEGPLHCTVINMGRESYPLKVGDRIMRTLIFQLDNYRQTSPLGDVTPTTRVENQITTELLARLSIDFLDVEKRAKSVAESIVSAATWRTTWIAALLPIGLAILTTLGAVYLSPLQSTKDDIVKLRADLSATASRIEEKQDFYMLENKIASLNDHLTANNKFDERLKALEDRVYVPSARPLDKQ